MWEDMLNDKLGMNCFNLEAEHASEGPAFVISIGGHRRVVPLLKQWQGIDQFRLPWQPGALHHFPSSSYYAVPTFRNIFMNCKDKLLNNAKEAPMLKCQSDGGQALPDYPITSLSVLWLSWHFFYKANDVCRKKKKS